MPTLPGHPAIRSVVVANSAGGNLVTPVHTLGIVAELLQLSEP